MRPVQAMQMARTEDVGNKEALDKGLTEWKGDSDKRARGRNKNTES